MYNSSYCVLGIIMEESHLSWLGVYNDGISLMNRDGENLRKFFTIATGPSCMAPSSQLPDLRRFFNLSFAVAFWHSHLDPLTQIVRWGPVH